MTDLIGWPGVPAAALGAVLAMGTLLWLLSLRLRDASIVDTFWGPFFLLQAAIYAALLDGFDGRRLLVLALVAAWSLRLATHISARHAAKGEDSRYARWREEHGSAWPMRTLERTIAERREGYAEYMETTSPFIPLPPKSR